MKIVDDESLFAYFGDLESGSVFTDFGYVYIKIYPYRWPIELDACNAIRLDNGGTAFYDDKAKVNYYPNAKLSLF